MVCRLQEEESKSARNWAKGPEISVFDIKQLDEDKAFFYRCKKTLEEADFVLIWLHGSLTCFKSYPEIQQLLQERIFCIYSGIEKENAEKEMHAKLTEEEYKKITDYLQAGGAENEGNMLAFLALCAGAGNELPPEPVFLLQDGIYYRSENARERQSAPSEQKYVIGILTHYYNVVNDDMEHVDALVREIERTGNSAFVLYSGISFDPDRGSPGLQQTIERYWYRNGTAMIDALLVVSGFSLTALSRCETDQQGIFSIFQELDVPVIQAPIMGISEKEWKASSQGLDAMSLCVNIYQPEFDGQLIGWPIACCEPVETVEGIRWKNRPVLKQTEKTVRLAVNWARLRKKPASKKRVAILLSQYSTEKGYDRLRVWPGYPKELGTYPSSVKRCRY